MAKKKPTQSAKKASPSGTFKNASEALAHFSELMKQNDLSEFEWEGKEFRVRLKSASGNEMRTFREIPVLDVSSKSSPSAGVSASSAPQSNPSEKTITSPFVGTFYRSPSPSAEPYVRVGQTIKRGDVLCIVEAMKLMNEIESEMSGKILKVLVENGQPVEFGEALFVVDIG